MYKETGAPGFTSATSPLLPAPHPAIPPERHKVMPLRKSAYGKADTHNTGRTGEQRRRRCPPRLSERTEAVDLWPRLAPRTPARPGNLRGTCSVSPLRTCRPIHIPTLIYGRRICEPQTGLRRLICVSETLAAQSSP